MTVIDSYTVFGENKMWSKDDEELLRKTLLEFDPEFEKTIGKGFYYIQMPSNDSRFYMRYQRACLEHLLNESTSKNTLMLDYGTGVGTFMVYMWKHGFTNMIGVDMDEHRLEACNRILKVFNCPFKTQLCKHGDIYDISGEYDIIFMNDFLYAKAIDLTGVAKSVHKALTRRGLWFFDLLEYEANMIPGSRKYYNEKEITDMLSARFYLIETITHISDGRGSRKTLYMMRKND